jgi:hypothetical protein
VCGFENKEIKIHTLYKWKEGAGLVKVDELYQREKLERAGISL